ncbi:MAG: outer membrane beta-barrel protein, partial [Campylobacteraceae bacterium]|nr:outer membrane beta-barrel protein [Campylobacteraceae bacterium]
MRKIVLALGVSAILVYAGNNEVTAVVGGVSPLSSNKYDDHITYGIRVGAGIKNAIIDQLEIGYDYSDNVKYTSIIYPPTKNKSSVHRFYFNAIKEFDISGAIKSAKPTKLYGLAGIGYQRFSKDVPTEKNGAFGQYGAGLKYYFTDNVALRGEVRHGIKFNSPHRSNLFYSLGITYAFGEKKQEVVVPPSLNDVTTPPVVKPVVK